MSQLFYMIIKKFIKRSNLRRKYQKLTRKCFFLFSLNIHVQDFFKNIMHISFIYNY
jgi:hypothetical protein